MTASPTEVNKWKRNPAVNKCYQNLYRPISDLDDQVTFFLRIVEKVFIESNKASEILIAYTMSVCEIFLNPDNDNIQISESVMKEKLEAKLVSFAI
jgi:hypothetical protein